MAYIAFEPKNRPGIGTAHPPIYDFEPDWPTIKDAPVEQSTWFLAASGLRIPPERFPRKAILTSSHKITEDIICVGTTNWTVSRRAKDVIESIAPQQVEFFPVAVVAKNNKKPINGNEYYYTNILPRIDTIDLAASNLTVRGVSARTGGRIVDFPVGGPRAPLKIVIRKIRYPDVQIWHEANLGEFGDWVFISDKLANAFKAASIEKLIYVHVNEA